MERLTLMEAARRLGWKSAVPVRKRIRDGAIRTVEFCGRTYVDASAVESLLEGSEEHAEDRHAAVAGRGA